MLNQLRRCKRRPLGHVVNCAPPELHDKMQPANWHKARYYNCCDIYMHTMHAWLTVQMLWQMQGRTLQAVHMLIVCMGIFSDILK